MSAIGEPIERVAFRCAEFAGMLGLHPRSIKRMVAQGKLPEPDVDLGRVKLWSRSVVDAFLRRNTPANGKK